MSSWFDRFTKVWGSKGFRDDPTTAQSEAGWAFLGQAPPTVEQFNATHAWWDQKDNWLYGQIAAVIQSTGVTPNDSDLSQLLTAIRAQQRYRLTTPFNVYVNSVSGNDASIIGGPTAPFKTINRALSFIHNDVDQGGQQVTILLAPGTYDPVSVSSPNLGLIVISGDRLAPRNYIIKNTNGAAVFASAGTQLWLQGLSLEAAGTSVGIGIQVMLGALVYIVDVAFGLCAYCHMWAQSAGTIVIAGTGLKYSIYATGTQSHAISAAGGVINIAQALLTIQNTPAFVGGFLMAETSATILAYLMTFTGTATGPRYVVSSVASINVLGAGISYLPGSTTGTATTGGVYV
jgi:hypothetical protein